MGSEQRTIVGRRVWGRGAQRALQYSPEVTLALPVWCPVGLHVALILAGVPSFTLP